MNEKDFLKMIETQATKFKNDGKSESDIQQWITRQKALFAQTNTGKTEESQIKLDAPVTPSTTASESGDSSSELFYPDLETKSRFIKGRFDQGSHSHEETEAFNHYRATGELSPELLGFLPMKKEDWEKSKEYKN